MPGGDRAEAFALDNPPTDLPEQGLLVNATSLGLKETDPAPFDVRILPKKWAVYDMVYNPDVTRLLQEARSQGLRATNGLSMLVHQGVRSLEIWSHVDVDAHSMMRAATQALGLPPRND
jgi:shikimate dehydrogenase